jgi:pimeloyl-ACP methyl ester carboxylesterase
VDVAMDPDAFADYDVSGSLAGVTVPVLAIAGAGDRATTPSDTGAIAVRAGDGRLVTIDGAGHFPYAERPEAWVAAVRAFVNRR